MEDAKNNKKISLVLGSGGARGLAHIGVIHWLEANGFQICSISGTSMGALIGGIYAAGELDTYTNWVKALEKIDVIRLLDISFSRNGLFKGERVIRELREMIYDCNIEDLSISFTAVATDLYEQKEVWLNKGPMFDAIRASIAMPTIFTPHEYEGRHLLDGSLINPVPIAPTLNDNTELTIAVDLNGKFNKSPKQEEVVKPNNRNKYHQRIVEFIGKMPFNKDEPESYNASFFDIITRSMETMQSRLTALQFATYSPDAVVSIPANSCTFYEFYRAAEMIELGGKSAEVSLKSLVSGEK